MCGIFPIWSLCTTVCTTMCVRTSVGEMEYKTGHRLIISPTWTTDACWTFYIQKWCVHTLAQCPYLCIQRGASYSIQRCAHSSSNPYIIHLFSIFIWILLPACLLPLSECSLFCAFIFLSFAISTHIWWRVEKCAREDNPNEYEIHRFAFLSFHRTAAYTECGRCCYTLALAHIHPGLIRSNKV